MEQSRLLVIAPYPIELPQHGGQKRVKAIVEAYTREFKYVKFVSVFHKASYKDYSSDDIPLGDTELLKKIDRSPAALDLIVGSSIDKDTHVRSFFAKLLYDFRPDIIHVEQVFLYSGLSKLLKELNFHPILIYGSQNIEYRLKSQIYSESLVVNATELIEETKALEERFSKEADLVVAVSSSDAIEHTKLGAKKVVIASNGTNTISGHKKKGYSSKIGKAKQSQHISSIISFVGSGHPPNYTGLEKLTNMDTTFLPSNSKLVIGGGVSEYFKKVYGDKLQNKFWKNVIATGALSEEDLMDLINHTDIFLLPILTGGGSNLKTAEAITANKKIVATDFAFRGFERQKSLPNIHIGNTESEFKSAILEALDAEFIFRSPSEQKIADEVLWESTLEPMVAAVEREAKKKRVLVKFKAGVITLRRRIRRTLRI